MAVVLIAWRRPYYLTRALDSWSKVRGVGDLALFRISLDASDRTEAMTEVAMSSPVPLEMTLNSPALGVGGNPRQAITDALRDCPEVQFVILAEEDLIVSDDVLEYFSWAADEFKARFEVLTVCAQISGAGTRLEEQQCAPSAVCTYPSFGCWVWGTWRERWFHVIGPTWDYSTPGEGYGGGDWAFNLAFRVMAPAGYVSAGPRLARSQNIGEHEGVHSSAADFPHTQLPFFSEHQDPVTFKEVPRAAWRSS